jgi:hypothetical protein
MKKKMEAMKNAEIYSLIIYATTGENEEIVNGPMSGSCINTVKKHANNASRQVPNSFLYF